MKRTFIAGITLTVLAFVVSFSSAQMGSGMMGEQKGDMQKGTMMGEGSSMMPMGQQMMREGMMQDMMQMMMNMMNMQEKMMMGTKPEEKKMMMKDMAKMKEKMHKMMSMGMMTGGMNGSQPNLKCAEEWLKKAIDLHEVHIKDPKTATEASQHDMMDQMKKAYGCMTGTGSEMISAPSQKPAAGEKKKDAHGH